MQRFGIKETRIVEITDDYAVLEETLEPDPTGPFAVFDDDIAWAKRQFRIEGNNPMLRAYIGSYREVSDGEDELIGDAKGRS